MELSRGPAAEIRVTQAEVHVARGPCSLLQARASHSSAHAHADRPLVL